MLQKLIEEGFITNETAGFFSKMAEQKYLKFIIKEFNQERKMGD